MSDATGASAENLSALSGVAKIGGHDLGMVGTSLQTLPKRCTGTGEETKAHRLRSKRSACLPQNSAEWTRQRRSPYRRRLDQFQDGSGKAAVAIVTSVNPGIAPFLKDLAEQSELVGR